MMYGLLLCAFYFIYYGEGFLLESSTTEPVGTQYLTYRHYMQLMELLFDEKQARHQLEQTVMKLQNKVNLVNNNNGVQESVNISEYIQPYIVRLEDQVKELITLRQSYGANLKSQENELNTLRHIVTHLQQNYTTLEQTTSKVQLDNGRLKQEVETLKLIKNIDVGNSLLATNNELHQLKVKSEARSQDFMALYNMATSQAQNIRQLSGTLENTYNDSTVDEMFIKVEKKISGLENLQNSASVALKDVVHNITGKAGGVKQLTVPLLPDSNCSMPENDAQCVIPVQRTSDHSVRCADEMADRFEDVSDEDIELLLDRNAGGVKQLTVPLLPDSNCSMPENDAQCVIPVQRTSDHSVRCADEMADRFEDVSDEDIELLLDRNGFTACGAVKLYGEFIKFTEIKTVYGITIANAYRGGRFHVTEGGFYLVFANILGSGSAFYIVVNNRAISRAWYDYNAQSGDGLHTAASSALVRLSPGDTVSIKSISADAGSCMTIVKL